MHAMDLFLFQLLGAVVLLLGEGICKAAGFIKADSYVHDSWKYCKGLKICSPYERDWLLNT